MGLFRYSGTLLYFCLLIVFETRVSGSQHIGQIYPGFEASQMEWIDKKGLFLLSQNSVFGFGFYPGLDVKSFVLCLIHIGSARVVWTANRGSLITNSDKFVFDKNGNVYLQRRTDVAWSTNTSGARVKSMELQDSGNLVLLGDSGSILWQSFSYPTDTLLPGQVFFENMTLKSFPTTNSLSVYLEIKSGDVVLYAGYRTPQTYWSLASDSRKTNKSLAGKVHSASLVSNAWNFYDLDNTLLWQLNFSENSDRNATWAAILGYNGALEFCNLQKGKTVVPEAIRIPQNSCGVPEPCSPYVVCYFENRCQCPPYLKSNVNCKPQIASKCTSSKNSAELVYVGEKLDYFALEFVTPFLRYDLDACKKACLHNCSCAVLFFENSTQSCFMFDQIGSFQRSQDESSGYISFVKVSTGHKESKGKIILLTVFIVAATLLVIAVLLYMGLWYHRKKKRSLEFPQESLEEDDFLGSFSGMPVRFSYSDLHFGLAKLMNREDSLVYTTLRGTRGYLAPEWITNSPISEKTDVYSYGVVLLEIIGGRRSFDLEDDSEKAHFPSYAFKMLGEGKLREILDPRLEINENDHGTVETAIKVALWCIQDDMQLRPPMTKVVQMLEGLCDAPQPATPSQHSAPVNSGFIKRSNEEGSSSGQHDDYSGAFLSDIRLSGPR
ncbi:hypothetical protein LWI28_024103 [Acer negundo]|uniref:Receptor-like serine/threonine-protein kinase n=1 Tax=Acer negundo TaxID=4023 RepID=A0AAD5IGY2_ACENE|nr:hypothetical protein LWI28_024103 [Acer negundo]